IRMQKKSTRLPPLDLLASFEAAARHLSFTRAGAERFVTQSAVSRQIKALEDELGVALFRRKHRALALTDDGRRLHETCTAVLAQLRDALAHIRAPDVRQVLALTTTPGFASLWLIPRLPSFTKAHPGIDVRIDATFERRELIGDGLDVAIRYGRVTAPHGTPLFRESMLPVCSPRLIRDKSRPLATPADLRLHTLLQVPVPSSSSMPLEWDPWLQAVGLADLRPAATLSFSNYDEAVTAALAGQGVALGRRPLIDHLLKSRKLIAPFRGTVASPRAYFLMIEPGARAKPAVGALERWLLDQARSRV
ncbi:MAG TPA: transcriptional regulator GcvA, partial [Burkholderiales bacterium]|nr:transcriptional regulator GcvA [Burkholderiales bacterium]